MTDDIVKALKNGGYDDIEKVGLMDATCVGRLTLLNTTTGAEVPLNESDKQVLKVALLFFCEDKADFYDYTNFMALTVRDWNEFNSALRRAYRNTGASVSTSATDGGISATTTDDGETTPASSKG